MQVNRKTVSGFAILTATAVAAIIPALAQAQGYGFDPDPFRYGYQPTEPAGMGLVRLLLIVALGGLGFGVGWFLSPHAKAFRRVILLGLGAIALLFIMFNGSLVSWAMAWAFGYVAFFGGIGYWLSGVVSKLGKTPTTFGSAKWANAEHLKAHKVFDPKPTKPKAEPATSLIDRTLGYFQEKAEVTPLKQKLFAPAGLTFPGLNQFQVDLPSFGSGNIADSLPTPVPKAKPGIRLGLAHDGERDEVFLELVEEVPEFQIPQEVRLFMLKLGLCLIGSLLLFCRAFARVLHLQGGGDDQQLLQAALVLTGQNHSSDARIDWQLGQAATDIGELVVVVEGAQFKQGLVTVPDGVRLRRIQEGEFLDRPQPQRLGLQNDSGQIGAANLRCSVFIAREEVVLRIQTNTNAGPDSSAAAGALIGRCLRDRFDRQTLHLRP